MTYMTRRRTRNYLRLAAALLREPDAKHYGYDLTKKAGMRSAIVFPALRRMLDDGHLVDGWDEQPHGRPPRRYYQLTETGRRVLGALTDGMNHSG